MLAYRFLTAAVLAPPLLYLILRGPDWGFAIVGVAAALISLYEYYQISSKEEPLFFKVICILLGLVLCFLA